MNYKMILYTIGQILKVEALLMLISLIVSLIFQDGMYMSFIIPFLIILFVSFIFTVRKPKNTTIYAKEGFIVVGLSWIALSLFGCLPFIISKSIPNFINAFFETVSGFTTTGATILNDVEVLAKSINFWRLFTHWIGGMGVLVFTLAVLPNSDGNSIHLLRAESPGPQVGKLVSKIRKTARILYLIYICLSLLQMLFLVCGDMNLYESIVHTFSTAGTGGLGIKNSSIAGYSSYSQIVIAVFMLLYGINFNIFYLFILGQAKEVLKSEELKWYFGIILFSIVVITLNVYGLYNNLFETIKHSSFQVIAIITTTGFATTDIGNWNSICQYICLMLMIIGACAGSTGGGLKVSRFVIFLKAIKMEIKGLLHPNTVNTLKFEGKPLNQNEVHSISVYFGFLLLLAFGISFIISVDGLPLITNISATFSCINNIGPLIGPDGSWLGNYDSFSGFSKLVLAMTMMVGRLEIFPIIVLFSKKTYLNK